LLSSNNNIACISIHKIFIKITLNGLKSISYSSYLGAKAPRDRKDTALILLAVAVRVSVMVAVLMQIIDCYL
jgi:hypothetical protein